MKIERVAFIGFGEAGQTISRGLLGAGTAQIRAYDIVPQAGFPGVEMARDHVDAVREADIVFLAVTASSSLQAALSCLPGLREGQLFLDINSVSPQRKIETAARIAPTGALYVDVAVMAPVAPYLHKVPCLIGGPGAEQLLPRARAMGMKMDFVSAEVGQASAIKMFRSIMIKGLEALVTESFTAARAYGVEDRVLASLHETFPTLDWETLGSYLMSRSALHGKRRAEEMREVAVTVREAGLEPWMASATAERQDWMGRQKGPLGLDKLGKDANWREYADKLLESRHKLGETKSS